MEKLKLPVFKGKMPEKRVLSMDDYLKFVIYNLRHTVKNRLKKKMRRESMVNVKFALE